MTPADLAQRFVTGHQAAAALQREEKRREGPLPDQAFAEAMALFEVVALLGPLSTVFIEARRTEDRVVQKRWAQVRAYYGR